MTLRDNAPRAQQAISMFRALAVVLVLMMGAGFWYINELSTGQAPDQIDDTPLGIMHNLLSLVELIVLVTAGVLFIRWLRRAYWNLHALGRRMEHGEGWAAGAWFVPFLNLFRPYSIVREVWRHTQLIAFEQVTPHGLLRVWWMVFLLHGFVSNATGRMDNAATTTEQLQSAAWGNMVTAGLMLATALLTIQVVQRIAGYEAQVDLRLEVSRIGAPVAVPAEHAEDQSEYEY